MELFLTIFPTFLFFLEHLYEFIIRQLSLKEVFDTGTCTIFVPPIPSKAYMDAKMPIIIYIFCKDIKKSA